MPAAAALPQVVAASWHAYARRSCVLRGPGQATCALRAQTAAMRSRPTGGTAGSARSTRRPPEVAGRPEAHDTVVTLPRTRVPAQGPGISFIPRGAWRSYAQPVDGCGDELQQCNSPGVAALKASPPVLALASKGHGIPVSLPPRPPEDLGSRRAPDSPPEPGILDRCCMCAGLQASSPAPAGLEGWPRRCRPLAGGGSSGRGSCAGHVALPGPA